jgi:biotin carboxyl carrier protein
MSDGERGPRMELTAQTGSATHEISLEPLAHRGADGEGARFRALIDGAEHSIDLLPVGRAGAFSLLLNGRPFDIRLGTSNASIVVGGRTIAVEIDEARRFRMRRAAGGSSASTSESVASPMPGKVIALPVVAGDIVRAGQTVAIVEAMKMQNELTAEREGRVKEIRVAAGQVVESGEILVVLEGLAP